MTLMKLRLFLASVSLGEHLLHCRRLWKLADALYSLWIRLDLTIADDVSKILYVFHAESTLVYIDR